MGSNRIRGMGICVYSAFVFFCAGSDLLRVVRSSKETNRLSKDQETEVKRTILQMPYTPEEATGINNK
jgi:hypothetical protein